MPWHAMNTFGSWSRARGEAKQHELIGTSSKRDGASAKPQELMQNQANGLAEE